MSKLGTALNLVILLQNHDYRLPAYWKYIASKHWGIMGHVQTIYNFESLDAPMTLNLNAIELYDGTVEATGSDLEYLNN